MAVVTAAVLAAGTLAAPLLVADVPMTGALLLGAATEAPGLAVRPGSDTGAFVAACDLLVPEPELQAVISMLATKQEVSILCMSDGFRVMYM